MSSMLKQDSIWLSLLDEVKGSERKRVGRENQGERKRAKESEQAAKAGRMWYECNRSYNEQYIEEHRDMNALGRIFKCVYIIHTSHSHGMNGM